MSIDTFRYGAETKTTKSEKYLFNEANIDGVLDFAAEKCPEVAEKREGILDAMSLILDDHKPTGDFYDSPDNALALLFAASLLDDSLQTDGKTSERVQRQRDTADAYSWLVMGDYSTTRPHTGEQKTTNLDHDSRLALFRKYENAQYSTDLKEWMNAHNELSELLQALGIPPEDARDFTPVVLKIGATYHMKGFGKTDVVNNRIKAWINAGNAFMREQGSDPKDCVPFAWVSTLNNQKYLCIPEPLVVALLEPELVEVEENEAIRNYLHGLVKHEYVHVQTTLEFVDVNDSEKGHRLGGLFTEYQAEVYSGKYFRDSYADIYNYIREIELTTGVSIDDLIRSSSSKYDFYLKLVNEFGLTNAAMMCGAMTADDIKYQSTDAGRELAGILSEHGPREELMVINGTEGVIKRFERHGKELSDEVLRSWCEYIGELSQS